MPEPATTATSASQDTAELRGLLRACGATRELADGRCVPIVGGLSNRAWRVDAGDTAWFVRVGHPDAARLGVDRHAECAVLQVVAGAGLAPELLACEPHLGLLVTRFVAGRTWSAADAALPDNLLRVAERLRALHALPPPSGAREVCYERQARHLEASVHGAHPHLAALRAMADRAFAALRERRTAPALCHHDLHHLNLLDDGTRLWIVDWEYGGRGDPLFDVAGFLAMHALDDSATAAFVQAYGRLGPRDLACLDHARWAFDYVQWLWYRTRFPEPTATEAGRIEGLAQRLLHCNNERMQRDDG